MKDGVRSLKDCLLRFNGVLDNEATLLTCGFCFAFLRYDLSMEHGGGDFALRQFGMVRAKDHPLLIKAILNRLNASGAIVGAAGRDAVVPRIGASQVIGACRE